ncbi:MAG TPA: glycosyltransferase, partial [bacterium]
MSVVVPCLNRAGYLAQTIDSILAQDYPHLECVVVDGGSTDGTVDLLRSYGEAVRWVSEPDRGHADAINKGWQMSRGTILAWLNADDVYVAVDAVSQIV